MIEGPGHMLHHLVPDEFLEAIVTAERLAPGTGESLTLESRDGDPLAA